MNDVRADTVVVMAKAPHPGLVKTRLEPLLGANGCAQLQATLIATAATLAVDAGYRARVATMPAAACDEVCALTPPPAEIVPQRGSSLGERMCCAVSDGFTAGADCVIVIGTDLPTLTVDRLPEVFSIDPLLWGGADVLAATLAVAEEAKLTVQLLPVERDLDVPDDAGALRDDPRLSAAVRSLLAPVEADA